MGIDSIVNTDSIEEYLKECVFDVVERDDEYVEFSSGAKTPGGMSKLPQEITAMEREAIEAMQEADEFSRDELVEKLEIDSPDQVSDLMRSLRYKGLVSFSFDRGFELENTE